MPTIHQGEGLLSRWAKVDKIPNLRDVGGFTNMYGRLLKRGVFYRSAGWNDNAETPKDRPESEWKKGKSRSNHLQFASINGKESPSCFFGDSVRFFLIFRIFMVK